MDKHLIIFIKNPELGKAKTRIAKTTGDKRALEIYKELLVHTREISIHTECKRHLYYSSFVDLKDEWPANHFDKKLQIKGGLGEKMRHAIKEVGAKKSSRILIIGSDCGELEPMILDQAFEALTKNDVVLGPTYDGGYYLLGLKDVGIDLFSDVEWSTESVYAQTIEKIETLGLSCFELPRLHDIDFEEDYIAWKRSIG